MDKNELTQAKHPLLLRVLRSLLGPEIEPVSGEYRFHERFEGPPTHYWRRVLASRHWGGHGPMSDNEEGCFVFRVEVTSRNAVETNPDASATLVLLIGLDEFDQKAHLFKLCLMGAGSVPYAKLTNIFAANYSQSLPEEYAQQLHTQMTIPYEVNYDGACYLEGLMRDLLNQMQKAEKRLFTQQSVRTMQYFHQELQARINEEER